MDLWIPTYGLLTCELGLGLPAREEDLHNELGPLG